MSNEHRKTNVDGVERFSPNGIKVLIVGGGVGGLGAALECWRKGCEVTVVERSSELSVVGDYFTLPPSAIANLKYYPNMVADYNSCVYNCTTSLWSPSGKLLFSRYPEWRRDNPTHPANGVDVSFLNMRATWAKWQLDQLARLDVPVIFGQDVVAMDESDNGVVVETKEGIEYQCDVCVLANGIATKMNGFNTEGAQHVLDTGYAAARVSFPVETINKDSLAYQLVKDVQTHPDFRVYVGADVHLILFLTPGHVAWVFTHKNDGTASESWGNFHEPDELLPYLYSASKEWDPAVIDFLKQTPSKVIDWSLRLRDSSYIWTSEEGRLIRLGDAAHTFLPTSGNGAVQALEDGMSLAECLRLGGKEKIGWSTKVHNKLRFERTSVLQQAGVMNREELHSVNIEALTQNPNDPKYTNVGFFKQGRWVWGHNAEDYATNNYDAALASLIDGKPFENTNLPPGHTYQPWTLMTEMVRIKSGTPSTLKENGYWGTDPSYFTEGAVVA